jgi:hypothetical protein
MANQSGSIGKQAASAIAKSDYGRQAAKTGGWLTGLAIGGSLLIGSFWLGKKFFGSAIAEIQEDNQNRQALKPGEAANYAARFRAAIEGWGTNTSNVFAILTEIPTQADVVAVDAAYKKLTGFYLSETLQKEWFWGSYETEKFNQILKSKPLK